MKSSDKEKKCIRLIQLLVYGGYDISEIVFNPISSFNEKAVDKWIKELEIEQELN